MLGFYICIAYENLADPYFLFLVDRFFVVE